MQQMDLKGLAQSRGTGQMHDSKFMSAAEKTKVLKHWELFLKSGLERDKFTRDLYHHLHQNCNFIAHYDINGFYATYFENGDDTIHFLSQFDTRDNRTPVSIEHGNCVRWPADEEYYDINIEMCRIAVRYIPALEMKAKSAQRHADLGHAEVLLKKHGLSLPGEVK